MTDRWPVRTMVVTGGPLSKPSCLKFEEKYGVWFCTDADDQMKRLLGDARSKDGPLGRTEPYFDAACRYFRMKFRWIDLPTSSLNGPELMGLRASR